MISFLSGKIIYKSGAKVEINVNGVGYEVFISSGDLAKFEVGKDAEVFIHQHLAEDKNDLYGFSSRQDSLVFKMLLTVSGIGPKTALGVFGAGSGEKILAAISKADVNFFKQVKGLGGKGAQRIIVDLKSKVGSISDMDFNIESEDESIYEALIGLGFSRLEVRKVLGKMPGDLKIENEKIKYCLRQLGKN